MRIRDWSSDVCSSDLLKAAGLDYYNHNIDTDPEFYGDIIHTREMQDRFDTLGHVRDAGMKTCCGGIVGMGESRRQRAGLLQTLATLPARSEERRVGKACVSTCRSRGSPDH